jgi:hypothetical protein
MAFKVTLDAIQAARLKPVFGMVEIERRDRSKGLGGPDSGLALFELGVCAQLDFGERAFCPLPSLIKIKCGQRPEAHAALLFPDPVLNNPGPLPA